MIGFDMILSHDNRELFITCTLDASMWACLCYPSIKDSLKRMIGEVEVVDVDHFERTHPAGSSAGDVVIVVPVTMKIVGGHEVGLTVQKADPRYFELLSTHDHTQRDVLKLKVVSHIHRDLDDEGPGCLRH